MKRWHLPSGLQQGIPFILAKDWTPVQAVAVVELLDDLRESKVDPGVKTIFQSV